MAFRSACIGATLALGTVFLSGCSEKGGNVCIGDLCTCVMSFNGTVTLFESELDWHEATRVQEAFVFNIDKQVANASINSDCCMATKAYLQNEFDDKEPTTSKKNFCKKCAHSPSPEIENATKSSECSSNSAKQFLSEAEFAGSVSHAENMILNQQNKEKKFATENNQDACEYGFFGFEANVNINHVLLPDVLFAFRFPNETNNSACCDATVAYMKYKYIDHSSGDLGKLSEPFCASCASSKNTGIRKAYGEKCGALNALNASIWL